MLCGASKSWRVALILLSMLLSHVSAMVRSPSCLMRRGSVTGCLSPFKSRFDCRAQFRPGGVSSAVLGDAAGTALVVLPTNQNCENLLRIRHTSAHVMAMAVQKLFPAVQVTIGPWIENGFYYDFYHPGGEQFSDEDLQTIKHEMDSIIKKKLPLVRTSLPMSFVAFTNYSIVHVVVPQEAGGSHTRGSSHSH
jgi:hypothetical protein